MSYYQRDKVTDVMAVLEAIRGEFTTRRNHRNTTELRKEAVRLVAESELRARRYKNADSALKTIHDACARRLRPQVGDEASTAFGDTLSLVVYDPLHSEEEERFVLIGDSYKDRLLVVVHTDRGDHIRLISARKATKKERKQYEENAQRSRPA